MFFTKPKQPPFSSLSDYYFPSSFPFFRLFPILPFSTSLFLLSSVPLSPPLFSLFSPFSLLSYPSFFHFISPSLASSLILTH